MNRTAASVALTACAAFVSTAVAGPFQDWNLVVRNNLTITSEVDGSALIGGNVSGTSNYAVQGVTASNGAGLMVGGNIAAGTNVQINNGGDLYHAGSVFGNANLNGGGSTFSDPTVSGTVSGVFSQANSLSSFLRDLAPTGTVDGAGNMNAATTTVGSHNVAVYSMTQATIGGLGQLNLNMGSADLVVINFDASASGGAANFAAPPNFVGGLNQANSSRIVWNFLNTTSLTVNNNFNGMILATMADLKLLGGGINGTVIVDNVSVMNAEIRRSTFGDFDLVVVPLPPAGWAGLTLLAGLAGVRAVRRR
jgi:choice-of-anchor A domain-containing protein